MTRRWLSPGWTLRVASLASVATLAHVQPVAALSCAPIPLATVARQAVAIFEATVSDVTVHPQPVVHHPDGTVSFFAQSRPATAQLRDVTALKGAAPTSVESSERVFEVGRRYLVLAIADGQKPGVARAGECAGYVLPAARSDGFRAWLASLERPPTGGRIIGSVIQHSEPDDIAAWPAVAGARVVARGPVTVETTSTADGQYALLGLPDGRYDVTVEMPEGQHGLLPPEPAKAVLDGPHAVSRWDFRVPVDGVVTGMVVDDNGAPVGNAQLYLHGGPRPGVVEDQPYWIGKTSADGRYEFRGVPPGYYVTTLGRPFAPAHAVTPEGAVEIVVGYAERRELAALVASRGTTVQTDGLVVDGAGRPVQTEIYLEVLGPLGPYPISRDVEESDASGRFRLGLLRGFRYRLTAIGEGPGQRVTRETVADGSLIRLVLP